MKFNIAQINTVIGDLVGNTDKILDIIKETVGRADVVIFPELAITGYPPLDLIERKGFCQEQIEQLERIKKSTVGVDLAVVVGYFRENLGDGKPFFNSLAFISEGKILLNYDKRLLPTYDIFDESRHFEPGDQTGVFKYKGVNLGFLICEDMWNDKAIIKGQFLYPINPVKQTADEGVDIIISINASPSNVGKPEYSKPSEKNMKSTLSTSTKWVATTTWFSMAQASAVSL